MTTPPKVPKPVRAKVTVTPKDIQNGLRCQPHCCPVALALQRLYGRGAGVAGGEWWIEEEGQRFRLPPWVRKWIDRFDGIYPVKPIEFQVVRKPAKGRRKGK